MSIPFRIERWTARGVTAEERPTKREANILAERLRTDPNTEQTVVTFPNGKVRVCRSVKKATK